MFILWLRPLVLSLALLSQLGVVLAVPPPVNIPTFIVFPNRWASGVMGYLNLQVLW
jgi:hypothetical protein